MIRVTTHNLPRTSGTGATELGWILVNESPRVGGVSTFQDALYFRRRRKAAGGAGAHRRRRASDCRLRVGAGTSDEELADSAC